MKLLLDMNLSPRWVGVLAEHSFQAIHWSFLGLATAPDTEILALARSLGYVILTHDLDFGNMLAVKNDPGPSVIQLRTDDISPESMASSVAQILRRFASELEAGALITVGPSKTRIGLLPLSH